MLMGRKGQLLRGLQTGFHRSAMTRPYWPLFLEQRRVCWLARFDPLHRACDGRFEAAHFIGRQQIRNLPAFVGVDGELIELAEWDARNGIPACTEHHRRFDNHADAGPGSAIVVPRDALDEELRDFIADWGLEALAERRLATEGGAA